MKLIPFLVALLVSAFLYLLVFERDALLDFTGSTEGVELEVEQIENTPEPVRLVSVVAMHSSAQTVDSAVMLRGRTEAARQVNVMAETSGKVILPPLRKGSYVEAGQTLCQLDPGTRAASLAQAKARLVEAKINENAARRLNQGGFASQTRVASAKASAQAAKAAVAATQNDIEHLTITAPFAGLLETDSAELGALLQPGTHCATIIQLDPIKLVGFAPETEVDRVTVGAMAGARLATGREVIGRVTFLSRSADPLTRTFRVEIEVSNTGLAIRDGQTVEILVASDGTSAHLLPQSALTLNNDGALGVRYVGRGNIVGFAPVTILRDTIEGVWVAGLPDKIDVIVSGHEYVIAGVKIDATYREPPQ